MGEEHKSNSLLQLHHSDYVFLSECWQVIKEEIDTQ